MKTCWFTFGPIPMLKLVETVRAQKKKQRDHWLHGGDDLGDSASIHSPSWFAHLLGIVSLGKNPVEDHCGSAIKKI